MCYQPVTIQIKGSDNEYMRVPCGHCYECFNLKSFRNTLLLNQESEHYKYCMFVTLTYNMKYVPVARFESFVYDHPKDRFSSLGDVIPGYESDRMYYVRLYNLSSRLCSLYDDNLIAFDTFNQSDYEQIYETFQKNVYRHFPPFTFPYASGYDAQTFIKRLRNHIKYTFRRNEKYKQMSIRYYIASEYGPQTFRPHFHALIYFNSSALYRKFGRITRKAWKFGRVDISLSRGGTASYCASYVAGNACLPPLHRIKKIRPKSWHSSHLGQSSFKIICEGFDAFNFGRLNNEYTVFCGRARHVPPSFQVQGSLFPRCLGYGRSSHQVRYLRYTILSRIRYFYPKGTLRDLAKRLVKHTVANDSLFQSFIDCLPKSYKFMEDVYYRMLCVSSRFIKMCRLLCCTSEQYLCKIEEYYECLERSLLKKFYSDPDHPVTVYSYTNLTDKTPTEDLAKFAKLRFGFGLSKLEKIIDRWNTSDNPLFVSAYDKAQRIFYNRFKHRELCDSLGLFDYDTNQLKLQSQLINY